MARPRMFDESTVLLAAADVFRRHGYADATTDQLCAAAGIGRGSLYKAFTSKDDLFAKALMEHLKATRNAERMLLEESGRTGFERLTALLDMVIEEEAAAAMNGHAAGCLTVGTLMTPDLRSRDDRLDAVLAADRRIRHQGIEHAVGIGQADGSISRQVSADDVGWAVSGLIAGLRVNAQAGATVATLKRVAVAGLAFLRT